MKRWIPLVAVVVISLAAACADSGAPANPEVARLQRHFATVDAELRAADLSQLQPAQRIARAAAVERLRRYSDRGVFPHNHGRIGRTPFFVDAHGTRCAMAHLIEEAGGGELVATIAGSRNNAYVPELADDPELVAWLDRNGLSAAEAARIQPAYDGCGFEDCSTDVDRRFAIASLGLAVIDGAAIATNLRADAGTSAGGFGVVAGGITMLLGYAHAEGPEPQRSLERDLGWVDVGIGAVTAAVSLRTLLRDRSGAPVSAAPAGPPGGWSVAPILGPTRGVSLRTSF